MVRRAIPKDAIIAVGDIHGCDEALELMLAALLPLPNKVVFLGDYTDRGRSSPRVIGQLIFAKMRRPDWVFLLGNHEYMLLQDIDMKVSFLEDHSAYAQYNDIGGVPASHRDFLNDLTIYWESETFLFIHGGIEGEVDKSAAHHSINELVWTYEINEKWEGKRIVRGHFVEEEPRERFNYIGVDTGCVFDGWLSGAVLDDDTGELMEAIQVRKDGRELRHWVPKSNGLKVES